MPVVRIVVVQAAVRVDDSRIVRIGRVRRAQPGVTNGTANIATALHIKFLIDTFLCRTLSRLLIGRLFGVLTPSNIRLVYPRYSPRRMRRL